MTDTIAFDIYHTETLRLGTQIYTVNFTQRKDSEEYLLIATNQENKKQFRYFYTCEVAKDFKNYNGLALETAVFQVLKDDIELAQNNA